MWWPNQYPPKTRLLVSAAAATYMHGDLVLFDLDLDLGRLRTSCATALGRWGVIEVHLTLLARTALQAVNVLPAVNQLIELLCD
jgi:hypothetical protein